MIILNEAYDDPVDRANEKVVRKILDAIKADKYDKPLKLDNNVEVRFDEKNDKDGFLTYDFQIYQSKTYLNTISLKFSTKYIDYEVSK